MQELIHLTPPEIVAYLLHSISFDRARYRPHVAGRLRHGGSGPPTMASPDPYQKLAT